MSNYLVEFLRTALDRLGDTEPPKAPLTIATETTATGTRLFLHAYQVPAAALTPYLTDLTDDRLPMVRAIGNDRYTLVYDEAEGVQLDVFVAKPQAIDALAKGAARLPDPEVEAWEWTSREAELTELAEAADLS